MKMTATPAIPSSIATTFCTRDSLVGQEDPSDRKSENRDRCLQHRREARGDVLLAPEDTAVVDRELQNAGKRDQPPFLCRLRQRDPLQFDHDKQDRGRENETRADENAIGGRSPRPILIKIHVVPQIKARMSQTSTFRENLGILVK